MNCFKPKSAMNVARTGPDAFSRMERQRIKVWLNAAYDQAIGGAVSTTGAALVDIASTFQAAETARAAGQPFPVDNQGDFYDRFEHVVLLSVEPLLRRTATTELDGQASVSELAAAVEELT